MDNNKDIYLDNNKNNKDKKDSMDKNNIAHIHKNYPRSLQSFYKL
jgi:hypothetical protein